MVILGNFKDKYDTVQLNLVININTLTFNTGTMNPPLNGYCPTYTFIK